jgi:hypothetical protein
MIMRETQTKDIPLLDLKAQYETIKEEVRGAIDEVLESGQYSMLQNSNKKWQIIAESGMQLESQMVQMLYY